MFLRFCLNKSTLFPEAFLQCDCTIEDKLTGTGVLVIKTEITLMHKLEAH